MRLALALVLALAASPAAGQNINGGLNVPGGGGGGVTSVTCGSGLTGGTITTTGTCALDTTTTVWFPSYVSGNWYTTPFSVMGGGATPSSNLAYCYPFPIFTSVIIKGIGSRVSTTGAGNTSWAIYGNSAGFPNGAALATTTTISNAIAPGILNLATGATATLTPGTYWACTASTDSTVIFSGIAAAGGPSGWMSGATNALIANLTGAGTQQIGYSQTVTVGTWPSFNGTGWTSVIFAKVPAIFFQVN